MLLVWKDCAAALVAMRIATHNTHEEYRLNLIRGEFRKVIAEQDTTVAESGLAIFPAQVFALRIPRIVHRAQI